MSRVPDDQLNLLFFSLIFIIILVICIFYILYYATDLQGNSKHNSVKGENKIFQKAALASTSQLCDEYVIDVFKKGGSAADAAIVALTIQGLTSPQSLGIGGGFLLVYYDRVNKEAHFLNAREYSPSKTTRDMYRNSKSPNWGGLASAIPGEVYGYWELHKKFGKLPWDSLFVPAIELCSKGIPVTEVTGEMLIKMRTFIMESPTLKEIFCDPKTDDVYKFGDKITRPALARTFEALARDGANALYNGILTEEFVNDNVENGGILTIEDMNSYRARWRRPLSMNIAKDKKVYTSASPGSGQVFLSVLDVIFNKIGIKEQPGLNWFHIVETWKHAFGHRSIMDGPTLYEELEEESYDPSLAKMMFEIIQKETATSADVRHYSPDFDKSLREGGTCHISLLAPDGDAVSVTSSVNYAIGAMCASRSTGIIFNNHMMDFAIPNYSDKFYVTNQLAPNKQPVSCMVPSIIVNTKTGKVLTVVGAAGGFKILTSASQLIIETLLYGIPPESAITHRRLHHQLIPMVLFYEDDFPKRILEELKKFGHHIEKILPGTSAAIITVNSDGIRANGDPRRMGSQSGY